MQYYEKHLIKSLYRLLFLSKNVELSELGKDMSGFRLAVCDSLTSKNQVFARQGVGRLRNLAKIGGRRMGLPHDIRFIKTSVACLLVSESDHP